MAPALVHPLAFEGSRCSILVTLLTATQAEILPAPVSPILRFSRAMADGRFCTAVIRAERPNKIRFDLAKNSPQKLPLANKTDIFDTSAILIPNNLLKTRIA
jgi:hypothetical protein